MTAPSLSHLARPGATVAVRVTPRAAREALVATDEGIRIYVTAPPEGGRATEAARALLARALGLAPSRLELLRGVASRDKVFRISG
ncbi:MAG: DUF167 domain-containing protein [Rhodobacteraceae bacterium]|nr:DUF167 domain-containing protein [Paracoccaceae bacterium]